jgi:hypothetical protein
MICSKALVQAVDVIFWNLYEKQTNCCKFFLLNFEMCCAAANRMSKKCEEILSKMIAKCQLSPHRTLQCWSIDSSQSSPANDKLFICGDDWKVTIGMIEWGLSSNVRDVMLCWNANLVVAPHICIFGTTTTYEWYIAAVLRNVAACSNLASSRKKPRMCGNRISSHKENHQKLSKICRVQKQNSAYFWSFPLILHLWGYRVAARLASNRTKRREIGWRHIQAYMLCSTNF